MELIYYWINKKKCIHEQGFCFSPEYNISMRKPEPEKYELEISRNKRTGGGRKVPYMLQKKHKMVAGRILGFSCRVGP